ncbi:YceI family protein [Xanthobacter sp. DSM 24535]|uniref:YceI family protein n=1 Tax=Roseixanthobacter psychrophilus TaxID=3119917 RepID=UPI003728DA96
MQLARLPATFFALALLALPAQAQEAGSSDPGAVKAGTYLLDPGHSRVAWSVTHLGFSTYTGLLPAAEGTLVLDPAAPEKSTLIVTLQTGKVGTLDPALDQHLKGTDFFNVEKFPTATFKATGVVATGKTAKITCDLTLLGVTKPVILDVTFNKAGTNPLDKTYSLGFDARAVIKRSDFGMTTYVPAVSDEVTLQIESEFKAK